MPKLVCRKLVYRCRKESVSTHENNDTHTKQIQKKRLLFCFKNGILQKKKETLACPGTTGCFYFKIEP